LERSETEQIKISKLKGEYGSVQHILAAFVDSRNIYPASFSTELFFAKAMRIHHIITGWNRFRGAPKQDVFELPFDPTISTFLEEAVPPRSLPTPGAIWPAKEITVLSF
jgi:hypothetical protein